MSKKVNSWDGNKSKIYLLKSFSVSSLTSVKLDKVLAGPHTYWLHPVRDASKI